MNNIQIVFKWLPIEPNDCEIFENCLELKKSSLELLQKINTVLTSIKRKQFGKNLQNLNIQELESIAENMDNIEKSFKLVCMKTKNFNKNTTILVEKIKLINDHLWKINLTIMYFIQELINEIAPLYFCYGENLLILTLKISLIYNNLFKMFGFQQNTNICSNTCPYLQNSLKKMSISRLLQIIAINRAEDCCHKLIDCLLETYKSYEGQDEDSSDNSSLEIYRALTKHMSPPENENLSTINLEQTFPTIDNLILYEEENVFYFLSVTLKTVPEMLDNSIVRKSENSDLKLGKKAVEKFLNYYEKILWGEVANYLEHIVLLWGSSPLLIRPPHSSQHLRDWINQFTPAAEMSSVVLAALASLADALGVHVTSTSWDHLFRDALVAASTNKDQEAGKLFCGVLQNLIVLANQCETTSDWIEGAPLDELPLVEQIPVLHRLDHSIHMTRIWAVNEAKKLANMWNVNGFFSVIHKDIANCLVHLNLLHFSDHTAEIKKDPSVHVQVCTLMRAKLVLEINVNIQKLKETANECIKGLANVCRIISLANLQMIYPLNSFWKLTNATLPDKPSSYVDKYMAQILSPILLATNDHLIINMILQIMCEAWLDHIYINKIKFSQFGAYQLLRDFAYIHTWLNNCPIITNDIRQKMIKNEALRRCEGVGRLLLRCPGEQIKMFDKNGKEPDLKENAELMPAEMYVPNQEKWLELRTIQRKKFLCNPLCSKF